MTITVDTANISIMTPETNKGSPTTFSHTCGADVDLLVVVITIYDTSSGDGVVSGVTYNGDPLDDATLYYDALCDGHVSIWWMAKPDTGSSYTVEMTHGGTCTDIEAAAVGVEGTVGSFALDDAGSPNTGTTGDLFITWDAIAEDSISFAAALDDQGDAGKVTPQETEIYTVDVGDVVSAEYAIRSASGSQTMTIADADGDEDWVIVGAGFYELVGATEYQQSTDGVLTPVGSIIKSGRKILGGASTLSGVISKATTKTFTGSSTWTGILVKQTQKIFTGASTFAGSLAASKRKLISLTGSLTPSGTLIKSTAKLFAGSVTAAGTLIRQTGKILLGSLTASGVLSTTKVTLLSIGGSVTASGILVKQTVKAFIGATTATGLLIRSMVKAFTGSITSSGILSTTKVTLLDIGGSITATGTLIKQTAITIIGSIIAVGSLATQKTAVGGEQFYKAVGGVLTMTGSITRRFGRNISGVLTMVGAVFRHSIGLPTPARRIYPIASENRIYAIQRLVRGARL